MKYTTFKSILKSFKDSNLAEPMVSLGNSFELPALFRGIGWRIIFACFPSKVKVTKRLKRLFIFSRYILHMSKKHGATTTVKYLKASTLAIQKAIAGTPLDSLRALEPTLPLPRLQNGLPRFIPIEDRRAIRRGNPDVIRFWLTLYSVYRIIRIPGVLKLKTITDPTSATAFDLQMGSAKLLHIVNQFKDRFDFKILSKEVWLLPIEKASPSSPVSWTTWFSTPVLLCLHYPAMFSLFNEFMSLNPAYARLQAYFNMIATSKTVRKDTSSLVNPDVPIGKLSTKEEAAGKIRVFAMVDVWTQSLLKPLHDFLFAFLRNLPNDGTFDQGGAVARAKEKAAITGVSFGYDLSAATDRLPISLQVSVLTPLIGERFAKLWSKILVDRAYTLEHNKEKFVLKYKVGQPMGALSSWAMLAVTHHFIVQLAYKQVYPANKTSWYSNYELLGDDIVLFEEAVAKAYLQIMLSFGVDINLSKSVISNNGSFEFAKVTSFKGQTVSAVSWRMFMSQRTRMGRVNILNYLLKSIGTIKHPVRYIKNMVMFRPGMLGDYGFSLIALLTMASTSSPRFSFEELLRTLGSVSIASHNYIKQIIGAQNITYLEYIINSIYRGTEIVLSKAPLADMSFAMDHPFQKICIKDNLLNWKSKVTQFSMRDDLVKAIVEKYLPSLPDQAKVLMWPHNLPVTEFIWDQRLFQSIYFTVDHFFKGFDELWGELMLDLTLLPIQRLLDMKAKRDRFVELASLMLRAEKKISGGLDSKLQRTESLKALQFIVDASKDRPLWTYDIERMSHLRYMRISRSSFTDW